MGERLFFSPRLSGDGKLFCASCHQPGRGGTDGLPRVQVTDSMGRNTLALMNVRLHQWFGWDGVSNTLWGQSLHPLLDKQKMNSSAAHVAELMRGDPGMLQSYEQAFGRKPPADPEAVLADVGKALAAYMETLTSPRTAFDEFRDAVANGDAVAAANYPLAAQRGLALFIGKEQCASCHSGPNFSDGRFHLSSGRSADLGRQVALGRLRISPYTLAGRYNDNPARNAAAENDFGDVDGFRTPGLRNVAMTAPYMHDGGLATLCDVVRIHPLEARTARGTLSRRERNELVVFLNSLSSQRAELDTTPCN